MRISDWSSDVCSSDLALFPDALGGRRLRQRATAALGVGRRRAERDAGAPAGEGGAGGAARRAAAGKAQVQAARDACALQVASRRAAGELFRGALAVPRAALRRSEEHTSELQSLMRI